MNTPGSSEDVSPSPINLNSLSIVNTSNNKDNNNDSTTGNLQKAVPSMITSNINNKNNDNININVNSQNAQQQFGNENDTTTSHTKSNQNTTMTSGNTTTNFGNNDRESGVIVSKINVRGKIHEQIFLLYSNEQMAIIIHFFLS